MKEPAQTLIGELERVVSTLGGAVLYPGLGAGAVKRFETVMGVKPPPGLGAFLAAHNGGVLGPELRILTLEESAARLGAARGAPGAAAAGWAAGLWPAVERAGRRYALDAEEAAAGDGEWPVVEVTERGVDRVGTSFLRFLHVLGAELGAGSVSGESAIALAETRTRRDPGHADHWLDLAELLEAAGRGEEIDATLAAALRAATPPTPALMLAIGMRAAQAGDEEAALRAFRDAIALEPVGARDDDARLDGAALVHVLASERGEAAEAAAARALLGGGSAATAAYWRGEALAALGAPDAPAPDAPADPHPANRPAARMGELALRIVAALEPADSDLPRLRAPTPELRAGLGRLQRAREALEAGNGDLASSEAAAAMTSPALAELGVAQAFYAEVLNAVHDPGATAAARRATEINPTLLDGWRELGDAELEAGALKQAEAAFRQVIAMDATYGLGYAKLAQVLLEEGRTLEALEAIGEAASRGGDPFFIAAIRGDIYAEMERHTDAAEAYDQALAFEPDDHWALHQAAIEHGFAGHPSRASELFQAALDHDREGCHQTLVDYGDHLRRLGRIGDAVKLYRRAVAAVPNESDWKQTLREAERELLAAPN
jgi:tetratricopeptide (TPR) repeat protein